MYCKNCNREIADNVRFCTYCGADQTAVPNQAVTGNRIDPNQPMGPNRPVYSQPVYPNQITSKADNSSILLFVFIAIYVLTGLIMTIISNTSDFYYESSWKVIYGLLAIIHNLSLLLVPLAIKKTPLKIIAFVLLTPLILYYLFKLIQNFIL